MIDLDCAVSPDVFVSDAFYLFKRFGRGNFWKTLPVSAFG